LSNAYATTQRVIVVKGGIVAVIVLITGRKRVPLFHIGDNAPEPTEAGLPLAAGIFVAAPLIHD
jgi:hypothetical protein